MFKSLARLVLEKVDPSAVLALKRLARPRCKSEKSPSAGEFIQRSRDQAQIRIKLEIRFGNGGTTMTVVKCKFLEGGRL